VKQCFTDSLWVPYTPTRSLAAPAVRFANHPFWSLTRDCWVNLGELQPGERLLLADGGEGVVECVQAEYALPCGGGTLGTPTNERGLFSVYNFKVHEWHTYHVAEYVDRPFVFVHNAPCAPLLPEPTPQPLGGGRTFSHFTDANGVTGITGVVGESLEVGQVVHVGELRFARGTNPFLAEQAGDIFVTELGPGASSSELSRIGVIGPKQSFVIEFSEEAAFNQGVRVKGSVPSRSIYSIPGDTIVRGVFRITRRK